MPSLNQIVNDIKALKIQGANNVAKAAVSAIHDFSAKFNMGGEDLFIESLDRAAQKLINARATEPALRNALRYVLYDLEKAKCGNVIRLKGYVELNAKKALDHFKTSEERIADFGSRKIRKGMVVYTHCHSSTVIKILKTAKSKGVNFDVHNTETRPLLQGRSTARELAKAGINVVHYVDSGARYALKKADIVLLGADAITSEGFVANKIGSAMFAEMASDLQIPVYCCANSWKFDPSTAYGFVEAIEERNADEVWKGAPKNIVVRNPAFELIDSKHITGIISELGVYKPDVFVEEVKDRYRWMFK